SRAPRRRSSFHGSARRNPTRRGRGRAVGPSACSGRTPLRPNRGSSRLPPRGSTGALPRTPPRSSSPSSPRSRSCRSRGSDPLPLLLHRCLRRPLVPRFRRLRSPPYSSAQRYFACPPCSPSLCSSHRRCRKQQPGQGSPFRHTPGGSSSFFACFEFLVRGTRTRRRGGTRRLVGGDSDIRTINVVHRFRR